MKKTLIWIVVIALFLNFAVAKDQGDMLNRIFRF